MTRYIKFGANGKAVEAPKTIEKDGKLILGYNKPSNEAMLLADGYIAYDGNYSVAALRFENGQVVEPEPVAQMENTVFSKLQIRRAMRALGQEDLLDTIISGNTEFAKDWQDAQYIDLNDEGFINAIQQWEIGQSAIDQIIAQINQ